MPLWQPSNALARPAYYDRDPYPIAYTYEANVAPHVATVRWSYAPPGGYAAFIEVCAGLLAGQGGWATPGIVLDRWNFLPFTGGTYTVLLNAMFAPVVNQIERVSLTSLGYLAYGDSVEFSTFDNSIGGSDYHFGSMKGTEFLY